VKRVFPTGELSGASEFVRQTLEIECVVNQRARLYDRNERSREAVVELVKTQGGGKRAPKLSTISPMALKSAHPSTRNIEPKIPSPKSACDPKVSTWVEQRTAFA
jgi:hypothetical protein